MCFPCSFSECVTWNLVHIVTYISTFQVIDHIKLISDVQSWRKERRGGEMKIKVGGSVCVWERERERERRWKTIQHCAHHTIFCTYILHTIASPLNISKREPGVYFSALMSCAFIYCSTELKPQFAIAGNIIMCSSYQSIHANMHMLKIKS